MNYRQIKISGWQFELADDFPAGFPSDIVDAATFMDGRRSFFIKLPSSKSANVFKLDIYFKGRIYNLILKQYLSRSIIDIFKNILRPCRSYRAFRADLILKQYGFNVPDVAAVGKKTIAGIPIKNFLITAEITDSLPLYKILETNASQRQDIMIQLGQMTGRLHNENIFIGDLRLGNILGRPQNGKFQFFLLDNERTKKFDKLPQRLRLKNLVQIFFSRTDACDSEKKCFLDAYLSQQDIKIDREKLAAQITASVEKRLAAKRKSNRVSGTPCEK